MLIRSTGPLAEGFHLLTLGYSCHYLLTNGDHFCLFDPGLSIHAGVLQKRIGALGLKLENLEHIFVTHVHADRLGGVPLLMQQCPRAKLLVTPSIKNKLADPAICSSIYDLDGELSAQYKLAPSVARPSLSELQKCFANAESMPEAEGFDLWKQFKVRLVFFPGHTQESLAFYIQPHNFIIVDEGLGYYNGKNLSGPGGDYSLNACEESLDKLINLELSGICLPYMGVIIGDLVSKYLSEMKENIADLRNECKNAFLAGIPEVEIKQTIRESFYNMGISDPVLKYNQELTFNSVWNQVKQ